MPRLTRVHQKVFASNASNNGVFGSLQAGNPQTSNDVAVLQSLSAFENGWDDAIEQGDKLPPLEEFQGIQYGISYQQAYMLQEGIAEWNSSTTYYKGSLAKTISGSSFKLYCSLADNNTNKTVTDTSYWKKVMDSDDLYAYDSAVVHLAGAETITGAKTFTNSINRQGSWTAGTAPSSNIASSYNFTDSTGTVYGSVNKYYGSNGDFYTRLTAFKTDGTGQINLSLGYNPDGNARATCPTPDTGTNTTSTQIATTGWVNSVGNNVMHLTGNESVAGDKTFTGTIVSTNKGSGVPNNVLAVKTARGSGNFSDLIGLYDTANNCRCATIRAFNTAAEHSLLLGVNNFNDGQPNGINIAYDSSNNLTTTAHTPSSATNNSKEIATTAWVNSWVSANGGFSSFSKSQNGYLKIGNGVIIQWGRNEVTASGGQTITLPTAFTNSNYKVVSAMESSDGYGQLGITSRTTTNFTFNPNWAGTYAWIAIGY